MHMATYSDPWTHAVQRLTQRWTANRTGPGISTAAVAAVAVVSIAVRIRRRVGDDEVRLEWDVIPDPPTIAGLAAMLVMVVGIIPKRCPFARWAGPGCIWRPKHGKFRWRSVCPGQSDSGRFVTEVDDRSIGVILHGFYALLLVMFLLGGFCLAWVEASIMVSYIF